jgi:hypothetical protein
MVIEYTIRFFNGGVSIAQRVDGSGTDSGGNPSETPTPEIGFNPSEPPTPDSGGNPSEPPIPDTGGGGQGRVIAVILGPLVIGTSGPGQTGERVGTPGVTDLESFRDTRPKPGKKTPPEK